MLIIVISYSFYILKRLSGVNKLVFMPDEAWDILLVDKYTPANIVDLVGLVMLKLTFGWNIVLGKLPYMKGIPSMPDAFINRKLAKVIDREERSEVMKSFDWSRFQIFDASNYSVIYFDGPLLNGITDDDPHKREFTEIFNILGKYFPEKEIACKDYPTCSGDVSRMEITNVIEGFIPAEFLYNDKVKMYLGINSCAIANAEKGLAVSIIDLITWRSEELKDQLKEVLIQSSKSTILFPKSLEEFERIVAEVSRA